MMRVKDLKSHTLLTCKYYTIIFLLILTEITEMDVIITSTLFHANH